MEQQQLESALPSGKNSTPVCSTAVGRNGADVLLEMVQRQERKEATAKPQHYPLSQPARSSGYLSTASQSTV